MSIQTLYDKTMNVYNNARVDDGGGGFTTSETLHIENQPCYIEIASGKEQEFSGSMGILFTHLLFCDSIDINEDMWVVIDGVTYDVQVVDNQQRRDNHYEIKLLQRKKNT